MPNFQNPFGIPANALAYGPIVGETGRDQMFGAYGNKLGPNDIAVSPNYLNQFRMGQTVQVVDAKGNPIGNYRIADTSYISPGNPTSNTVEFRDADRSNQNVFLRDLSDAPVVNVDAPAGQGIQSVPGFQGAPISGYPDLSNSSMVTVNGPMSPGGDLYPRTPSGVAPGFSSPPQQSRPDVSPLQHALNVLASNFAQQQNMNAFALHDWNKGMWAANPTGGEQGRPDTHHNIGALAAKLGLMGRGAAGKMPVMFQ